MNDNAPADEDPVDEDPVDEDQTPVRGRRPRRSMSAAILAGAMVGLRDIFEERESQETPVVVDSPTDPTDIDVDGVRVESHDQTFHAPAPPPVLTKKPRRPASTAKKSTAKKKKARRTDGTS